MKHGPIHCGGSLISCQHILTAAHCIENKHTGDLFDTNKFYIVVGEHNVCIYNITFVTKANILLRNNLQFLLFVV